MMVPNFTLRRATELRPAIQRIVDERLDAMIEQGPPAELVGAFALPVPSMVICSLLGVPYADHEFFEAQSRRLLRGPEPADTLDARQQLEAYLGDLLDGKAKLPQPGEGILDDLVHHQLREGSVDRAEAVSLAVILLVAGHETTANMISLGTVALLENPEQRAQVVVDSSLLPDAIEEMLRYFSIVEGATARVATADIELGEVTIRKDEGFIVAGLAANWDDAVFEHPERLDFHRGARHHIAFGYGVHQCLGQNLARVELELVFETLFRRVPGLTLAVPADDLPYKDDAGIYGIYHVPVKF
jgi:pentalenic acid synthase